MKEEISVIFDCDGTLLKSLGLGMDAYDYALQKVGAKKHTPEDIKRFFGRSADKIFFQLLGDREKATLAYEYYLEIERGQVDRIVPHQGIPELLLKLKSRSITLGVVTGRHSRELEFLLSENNLTAYFDVFVCDDQLGHSKPHPEGLLLASSKLKRAPTQCFYVGDAVMDMQAARLAGARAIAALWDDWVDPFRMEQEGPSFSTKRPLDIFDWISSQSLD